MFLLYIKTIFIDLYKKINLKINLIYNYFLNQLILDFYNLILDISKNWFYKTYFFIKWNISN